MNCIEFGSSICTLTYSVQIERRNLALPSDFSNIKRNLTIFGSEITKTTRVWFLKIIRQTYFSEKKFTLKN